MHRFTSVVAHAAGALLAAAAAGVHASPTTLSYTGVVSFVHAATRGPAGPADILVGTPVSFSVTYDPSRLVSFPPTMAQDYLTGAPMAVFPKGVPLGNDPAAAYSVTIASHTWTLADDISDGYIDEIGMGPYPFVAYEGQPSRVIGLAIDTVVGGLEFYSTPADFLLQDNRHVAFGFLANEDESNSDYLFTVDTSLDPTIDAIRQEELAIAAVPEPSSWALLLLGGAGLGAGRWGRKKFGSAPSVRPASTSVPR